MGIIDDGKRSAFGPQHLHATFGGAQRRKMRKDVRRGIARRTQYGDDAEQIRHVEVPRKRNFHVEASVV